MVTLPFSDNFNTDTTASYTKVGTWTWNSTNQNITHTSGSQEIMVQDMGVSDGITASCSIVINQTPSGTNEYQGLFIGANNLGGGTNKGYGLVFRGGASGGDTANIWLLDSNIAWVASGAFTWTTGVKYWVKIKRVGTTIYCRVWQDGNAEPSTWQITATVTARTDTWAGFGSSSSSSSAATYDDLSVINNPSAGGFFLAAA